MNVLDSVNLIRLSLVKSNLHFFINESPHSIWITVRKRAMHYNTRNNPSNNVTVHVSDDNEHLVIENEKLKNVVKDLQSEVESSKHKVSELSQKLEIAMNENKTFETAKEAFENGMKEKDYEILDLEDVNSKRKLKIEKLSKDLVEKENNCKVICKTSTNLKTDLDNITKEFESKAAEASSLSNSCKQLKENVKTIKKDNETLESKIRESRKLISNLQKKKTESVTKNEVGENKANTKANTKDINADPNLETSKCELKCSFCSFRGESKVALDLHIETVHDSDIFKTCSKNKSRKVWKRILPEKLDNFDHFSVVSQKLTESEHTCKDCKVGGMHFLSERVYYPSPGSFEYLLQNNLRVVPTTQTLVKR